MFFFLLSFLFFPFSDLTIVLWNGWGWVWPSNSLKKFCGVKSAFLPNTRLLLEVPMENKSNAVPCVGGLFYTHKDRVFWEQTRKCLSLFAVLCLLRGAASGGSSLPPNLSHTRHRGQRLMRMSLREVSGNCSSFPENSLASNIGLNSLMESWKTRVLSVPVDSWKRKNSTLQCVYASSLFSRLCF